MTAGPAITTKQERSARKRRPSSNKIGVEMYRPWWVSLLWIAPVVITVTTFSIVPFINTIGLSLTDARPLGGQVNFVGLENYENLFASERFWQATLNSVVYALIAVPLILILPLLLAVLVFKSVPFIGLFRSIYYIPAVASTVVVAIAWDYLFRSDGVINTTAIALNITETAFPFLSDRWLLQITAILLTVWKSLGFNMVLYIAALGNVDRSLYEAAEMDGAGGFKQFIHVTLPGVRIMMLLVGLLAIIGTLRIFSEIYLLGGATGGIGGQNATLPFFIREIGLAADGNLGLGSAASIALFVLTLIPILLSQRQSRKAEEAE